MTKKKAAMVKLENCSRRDDSMTLTEYFLFFLETLEVVYSSFPEFHFYDPVVVMLNEDHLFVATWPKSSFRGRLDEEFSSWPTGPKSYSWSPVQTKSPDRAHQVV